MLPYRFLDPGPGSDLFLRASRLFFVPVLTPSCFAIGNAGLVPYRKIVRLQPRR